VELTPVGHEEGERNEKAGVLQPDDFSDVHGNLSVPTSSPDRFVAVTHSDGS
jgi:hypothetical protein